MPANFPPKSATKRKRRMLLSSINRKAMYLFIVFMRRSYRNTEKSLYWLFVLAALFVLVIFSINVFVNKPDIMGPWGDFFGGVLNPLLTFLTFTGLLITIILQQTELKDSRREFKRSADALVAQNKSTERQIFESTFFQMLSLHNTIIDSIQLTNRSNEHRQGRECFVTFYSYFSERYERHSSIQKLERRKVDELAAINDAFRDFWDRNQRYLGHYYRYLYNIVRFINEKRPDEETYIRILRSQISDQELLLLFYNCMTPQGHKFKTLVEKFALINNIDKGQLLNKQHEFLISPSAFGQREEILQSDQHA